MQWGIYRAAVYFGECIDANFNIDAGVETEAGDVLGFLDSDAGQSENAWTTDKFDPISWELSPTNSQHLMLDSTNRLVKFDDVNFNFNTGNVIWCRFRDQAGLYGLRMPDNENEYKVFHYTINFPIGSGTVAVLHDGNLANQNTTLKSFHH